MRIDVITLFPESLDELTGLGVTGRAIKDGRVELKTWNPRDFAVDRHRTVDDRPYGGGPGMVMAVEPLSSTIRAVRDEQPADVPVSLMSPQGRKLDQAGINELAGRQGLILVCGRYEGIDERTVESEIDEEWSIGDYVISGGELAAAVIIDAVTRLLPGVLGDEQSAIEDSFVDGLLDHPHYTRLKWRAAGRYRKCCCQATTRLYVAGAGSRRWDAPGNDDRTCWKTGNWMKRRECCYRNFAVNWNTIVKAHKGLN